MRKHSKVYLGLKWMIFIFIGFSACTGKTEKAQPNILFIMADDHSTRAISCYDGIFAEKAKTVNIDRIAEEGMRFTNAFCTNSICSPSRATILTGKYSHKNGLYCLGQSFNMSQQTTVGLLGAAGYQTAVYGKWHLRCTPEGFDDYKVLPVQGRYQDPQFHVKGEDSLVIYAGWSTDIIVDMAGIAVPEDLQGESILPLLEGNTPDGWRRAVYYRYWQHLLHRDVTAHYGIRTKTHKLIYFYGLPLEMTNYPAVDPCWEFFGLANDPAEMNSLYHDPDQQALIKGLKQTLLKLKEQYGDTDDKYPELVKVNEKYFW